jgi:hypothetical protein
MALEGIWWWDNPSITDVVNAPPREEWNWKSMILVPDYITSVMLEEIKPDFIKKKGNSVEKVKLERFHDGLSAQILHIGSYSDEPRSIKLLYGLIEEKGYRLSGRHHEIYMSDPRRVPLEKLKTIIRHPIEKVKPGYPLMTSK